jgi:hypothetical protein
MAQIKILAEQHLLEDGLAEVHVHRQGIRRLW